MNASLKDLKNMNLSEKIKYLPDKPGVYLMKDKEGKIIYVGKALSLRKRVRSYFKLPEAMAPPFE